MGAWFALALPVAAAPPPRPPTFDIRLLADREIKEVTLTGYGGLRVCGQRASGPVTLRVQGNQVQARDGASLDVSSAVVTVASRADRWVDLQVPQGPSKRTVSHLRVQVVGSSLQIVNRLPLETYLLGIAEGELGSLDFPIESLKSQIIASRTYLLAVRSRHASEGFDFCDGPHCQAYRGTGSIRAEIKRAVESSRGQYLTFEGKPIFAYYHDSCGGQTAAVDEVWGGPPRPYLRSIEDREGGQVLCRYAPRASWSVMLDRRALNEAFRTEGWLGPYESLTSMRVSERDSSGRAREIFIQSNHVDWVPAARLRQVILRAMGADTLPSMHFQIRQYGAQFEFVGHGWGHGVGLCQWGAIQMGREGKTYQEILQHYYPGTQLERIPEPMYVLGLGSFNLN